MSCKYENACYVSRHRCAPGIARCYEDTDIPRVPMHDACACARCGGEPELVWYRGFECIGYKKVRYPVRDSWWVSCKSCGRKLNVYGTKRWYSSEKAVEEWNRYNAHRQLNLNLRKKT